MFCLVEIQTLWPSKTKIPPKIQVTVTVAYEGSCHVGECGWVGRPRTVGGYFSPQLNLPIFMPLKKVKLILQSQFNFALPQSWITHLAIGTCSLYLLLKMFVFEQRKSDQIQLGWEVPPYSARYTNSATLSGLSNAWQTPVAEHVGHADSAAWQWPLNVAW